MGMPSAVKEIGQRLGLSPIELAFMAFKESWASLLVGFPVSVVGGRTKLVLLPGSFSLLGALGLPPHPAPPLPDASGLPLKVPYRQQPSLLMFAVWL